MLWNETASSFICIFLGTKAKDKDHIFMSSTKQNSGSVHGKIRKNEEYWFKLLNWKA